MSDYGGSDTPLEIRDLWQTPAEVYEFMDSIYNFCADVAASEKNHLHDIFIDEGEDSLSVNWDERFGGGYVWCNPPYSHIHEWVNKASDCNKTGVVMLLPADTSVKWFEKSLITASEIFLVIGGRLSFVRADSGVKVNGNNKGSMFIVWHPARTGLGATIKTISRDELFSRGKDEKFK